MDSLLPITDPPNLQMEGGIVHALQPQIVQDVIARIDHRTCQGDSLCQRLGADPLG